MPAEDMNQLEEWLITERDDRVKHLRELANDLAVTSPRGVLEEGISINSKTPQLAEAMMEEGWIKLHWIQNGWFASRNGTQYFPVVESEVERVLGFPVPPRSR